jgi:hypothetical protein
LEQRERISGLLSSIFRFVFLALSLIEVVQVGVVCSALPVVGFDFGIGLIFGMSSTGGNAADSDDDLIICHVCLNFYNEGDRLPKFLDCHHSFCLSCIKVCRQRFPAKRISVLFCLLHSQISHFFTYYSINDLGLPSIR